MNTLRACALLLLVLVPAHADVAVLGASEHIRGLEPLPPRPAQLPATSPICRVVARMGNQQAWGSGTLVDHDLVVTNWHVVTPGPGEAPVTRVEVHFPGGFVSEARVLCVDPEWDLAALAIARPPVAPIPIAEQPPQVGELLTLAGYGSNGQLQQQAGQMLRYEAPSQHAPYELVAFRATARDGDSGGPVLNQRGQLVAVMFGTADGLTSATHCGRLRAFLARCRDWRPSLPRTQPLPPSASHTTPPPQQPQAPVIDRPSPELQRLQDEHDKLLAERDALERRAADAEAILPQLDGARQQLEACGKERLALEGRLHQVSGELEALQRQVTITTPAGPPPGVAAPATAGPSAGGAGPPAEGTASALETVLSKGAAAALTGALVSFGLPAGLAGVAAGGGVWLVMRRGKRRLQKKLEGMPIADVSAVERTRLAIQRVPVADGAFNRLVEALRRELSYNTPALPIITRIWSTFEQLGSNGEPQPYRDQSRPGASLGWQDPPPKE